MYMYVYIYIYIYICVYIYTYTIHNYVLCTGVLLYGRNIEMRKEIVESKEDPGDKSLDPGNLKFDTVRTHNQHICF